MALVENKGSITQIHELVGKRICLETLDEQIFATVTSVFLDKEHKRIVVSMTRTYRHSPSGGFYEYFYYTTESEELWLQELTYPDWDLNHMVDVRNVRILD